MTSPRQQLLIARCAEQREQMSQHWRSLSERAQQADRIKSIIRRFTLGLPRMALRIFLFWMIRRR